MLDIDSDKLYGPGMSQILPSAEIKVFLEKRLLTQNTAENGYVVELN